MDEHRRFLSAFDGLRDEACVPALRSLCLVFLEEFHHRKEEDLLFPVIAADRRVHAGGPECVLHFDMQMRSPPLETARSACAAAGVPALEPPWPPGSQSLREENSPLVIPLEDHEAGRVLLRGIDALPPGSEPVALRLLDAYRDLQARHFRKEDGCLFCMSRQLVDPGRWAEIERVEPQWTAAGLHPKAARALSATS